MAQTLAQIITSLNPAYDPERSVLNTAIGGLEGQQTGALSGLDTAKTNAFNDINVAANRKGMLYSGAPIDEQNRYVGEKFLPARADVVNNITGQRSNLQLQLAQIGQRQNTQAQGILSDQTKADQQAAADARQLALEREKMQNDLRVAQTRAASSSTTNAAKGYVKSIVAGGGLSYRDGAGNPITSAQYYEAKGATGIGAILADLQTSGNYDDTKIAADAASGKYSYDQLAQKYPYVFGGI